MASLGSVGSLGCATGELAVPQHAASAADGDAPYTSAPATYGLPSTYGREVTSPRTEGAGYLTLGVAPAVKLPALQLAPSAPSAPAEDHTATILNASERCPAEMALVDGRVCVDRWEASLVERVMAHPGAGGGSSERTWSPFLPVDGHVREVRAVSRPGVIPQAYISGKQAAAACGASGKRLCATEEWELACRGPDNSQFPYGDKRRPGACNDDIRAVHPVAEVGQMLGIAHGRLWQDGMNQPLINQLPNTLLPTGERSECTNGYGVYDMVGNVHEWVDDPDGTFRGGYYMDTTKNGDGCSYHTTAHDFTYHDYSTGFRCCMDPERVE